MHKQKKINIQTKCHNNISLDNST